MNYKMKKTLSEKIFTVANYTILISIGLICLLPYVNLFTKSVSNNAYVISGQVAFLPKGFNLNAYKVILSGGDFKTAFFNSVAITILGTVVQVFFTACVGYAVTKKDLIGRKAISFMYIFTMLFNGGMIPTYLVVKNMGLMNNLAVLVIPGMVSAFNLILVRNYFETLPDSLEESARMDGAGNLTVLFKIVLPISIPSLATITIFTAVGIWNNYMAPLMYLQQRTVKVLPLFLQGIITSSTKISADDPEVLSSIASQSFVAAAIFIATIPILLIYPFLQRYFIKGMTLGAVKQ